jgi:hypothetical protein
MQVSRQPGSGARIPRQQALTAGALDGTIHEFQSEGVSRPIAGAAITLRNLQDAHEIVATSSGDGVFRFLSFAVLVSSQNTNREWLYYTQQTTSAEGFAGQAFSSFVPHTVRAQETKQCGDCHVSATNDNNAWMAQLVLQGTNFMNFMGGYIYVATGKEGFEAIAVVEHDEPEAIFGSDLQRVAYPDNFKRFVAHNRDLFAVAAHEGTVLDIQARGDAYAATGTLGG